ncbi:prepilin-type N-terminal cleavage/methylation domain-containing protein [Xylella fastidiosa]|uniref:Prepilin-type N-terminal cleavage/methylation domain-containing protein n=2 Tax=Xylella fastidiosa TaxID=2371 RepID=A0ABC8ACQ0_XYLFS|nr:prepilin-type N-terminal cleavage/methylation domain-containing protein [Xylella fastidiosa]AAF84330.1 general secretory pathway protein I precursor [Xylella fastidiosa 9a5c]ALQ94851.1 general secretion pathway protein GspI [Xylella fastidiosa]ALR04313.1 prepilin-type N-terminal cleavage/methylation domain-containing protein [Xylella fastidiosa]ALR06218.1 prepilin-type N-terminal cleavage/methylation domain-containing protein [Xylella fastidiosa]ARO68848.1 general secretion pathway protein 
MKCQRGYSLLEVIVAFAILALALSLLLGTLTGGTRQVRRADLASQATLYAQSFLAQQGVAMPLHVQHQQGAFENGRFRWMLETRPYENSPRSPDGAQLLELILSVRWGDGPDQSLQWRTLRFVRLQPSGDEL